MIKKFLPFIAIILIQACSSDGYKKERDFRLSNNTNISDNSAIILTRNSAESISVGAIGSRYGSGFTEMNWCRNEDDEKCKEILYFSPYKRKKIYGQYNYYNIKSGKYYLDQIKELPNYTEDVLLPLKIIFDIATFGGFYNHNFNTSHSGWNKKLNAPNFASFETKPGEIVYIGDLYFTFIKQKYWVRGKINLDVQDNYDEAVKYFREKFPEYKNKPVVKRLAQPGVMLDNYDAGIFW